MRTTCTMAMLALCLPVLAAPVPARAATAAELSHAIWDTLLRTHVDEAGRVAYKTLASTDRARFDAYLATLASADVGSDTSPAALAFWINAYNAGIVKGILDGYSAESALKRATLFKWFTVPIAGTPRTLDAIEHEIIRPRFGDPRTHFALVCASSSCPRLRRGAYTADNLDAALDEQVRRFIRDPTRNVIDPAARRIALSAIFDWFAMDFTKAAGSVRGYVARWVDDPARRAMLLGDEPSIEYLPYDWAMNAQPGQRP